MESRRYQASNRLFKSDVHFDANLLANNNTPSVPTPAYQYANAANKTNRSQHMAIQDWNQHIPKWKQILGEEVSKTTGPSQSALLLQNTQQTAASLLNNVLNQSNTSLRSKCEEISKMCASFSNKELIDLYPQLLIEIFGFSGSASFGLNKYEPRKYCYDFNAAYSFLSTNGCVFKVINKLMTDQDAEFHFPYKGLPAGIVEKIKSGHISMWYQNKLMVLPGKEVVLACNALEYYMLLFAYYIIHPQTLQQPTQWSGVEDVLYVRLLEDYLKYFFPIDGLKQSSSALSPDIKLDSSSNLWKTSDYISPSHNQNSPHTPSAPLLNILPSPSHAEVFLQILCDLWFGLNPEEQSNPEQEYRLPSVDHARVVRILVKFLHTFLNGSTDVQMHLFSSSHCQQVDEFKSVVIPTLMYKSLYIYLQHCFAHWPLDGSFRMILETWLSFIQPWRYRDNTNNTNNKSMDDSIEVNLLQWKPFIRENTLFYSSIFQMFLLRALRFDMTSLHDVQLVYRVAKVFSQPSLSEFLQDEMEPHQPSQIGSRSVGGAMFLGLMSTAKKIQLEKPGHTVLPIFGAEVTKHVQDLCQMLASTATEIRQKSSRTANEKKSPGFLASIKSFFLIDDTTDFDRHREKQRLIEYLDQTFMLFTSAFKIPDFRTMPAVGESADGMNISKVTYSFADDSLPEFTLTESGVELTDMGRYQILQGMRQFPITFSGDPELQPIRSYESMLAVKSLYWVACKLNKKYSEVLHMLYNRPSYITKLLRGFSKRLHTNHYINTPFNLPQSTVPTHELTPRISLRFAASYYFMGYACWVIILARLFGFSWLTIIVTLILISIVCVFAHIDSPPKKFKEN